MTYAGPASNVRVERVSHDCFSGGGALAEVMSLYENMNEENLVNDDKRSIDVVEKGNHSSTIEVRCQLFCFFPFNRCIHLSSWFF